MGCCCLCVSQLLAGALSLTVRATPLDLSVLSRITTTPRVCSAFQRHMMYMALPGLVLR